MNTEAPETPRLLVAVRSPHLRPETRHHCKKCPVAVAMQEAVREQCGVVCEVIVDGVNYLFLPAAVQTRVYGPLPPPVRKFIEQFDRLGIGQPFSFYVPWPEFGNADAGGITCAMR